MAVNYDCVSLHINVSHSSSVYEGVRMVRVTQQIVCMCAEPTYVGLSVIRLQRSRRRVHGKGRTLHNLQCTPPVPSSIRTRWSLWRLRYPTGDWTRPRPSVFVSVSSFR
jgi:hypothetical protein